MTILLYPDIPPVKAPQLTLLMAIAVAEGIQEVTGLETKIKWPNDIVVNGRKICGILTEMSTEIDYINHVVIGVGINVNQDTFSDDIKATASSLKLELGKSVKRSELIAAVMKSFEKCYEIFIKTEDLSGLQELYNSMLVNRDQEVKVLEPGNEYKAHAIGINQTGELIVRTTGWERKRNTMPERYQLEVFMGMYDEKVVLCGANSYEEKYYLNPDDYTKKADGTASDVSNANFAGNAMAVIKKIYKRNIRSVQIVMYTSASGRLIRISSRLVLMSKEKLGTTCSFPCSMALLMETEG